MSALQHPKTDLTKGRFDSGSDSLTLSDNASRVQRSRERAADNRDEWDRFQFGGKCVRLLTPQLAQGRVGLAGNPALGIPLTLGMPR